MKPGLDYMKTSRQADKDPYSSFPYRIVSRKPPYFFALAYASSFADIEKDWKCVVFFLDGLLNSHPSYSSSDLHSYFLRAYLSQQGQIFRSALAKSTSSYYAIESEDELLNLREKIFRETEQGEETEGVEELSKKQILELGFARRVIINTCVETFFARMAGNVKHIQGVLASEKDIGKLDRYEAIINRRIEQLENSEEPPPEYVQLDEAFGLPPYAEVIMDTLRL